MNRIEVNKRLRSERLSLARQKGNHSKTEWKEMIKFFEYKCVKCMGSSGFPNIEKDHIIPIYLGGSHGLDNIQPLCAHCNSSKGPECIDYRPQAAALLHKKLPKIYKTYKP